MSQVMQLVRVCRLVLATAVGLILAAPAAQAQSLAERLQPLIDAHQGQVAVAVKHLATGESFVYRPDAVMPTASLIKFPLMIAAYEAMQQGRVTGDTLLTLDEEDKVPGSGILTLHFSAGMKLSVRDAIRLMMAFSDNTATNLVIEQVGLAEANQSFAQLGLKETRLNSQVYRRETSISPERSQRYGLGSTTAAEMIGLLTRLEANEFVSKEACDDMRGHLAACDDKLKFPRFLRQVKFQHKTGSVNAVRTDAGIMSTPAGRIALCVLTNENKDQSWGEKNAADILCGRVAEAVYRHFNPDADGTAELATGPLQLGAQGLLVEGLQRTLNARMQPSPDLGIDGDFGPATQAAVIAFQSSRGLPENGIVSPETWAALGPLVEVDETAAAAELKPWVRSPADSVGGVPFVSCKAWAVVDGETGRLVGGEREEESLPNASTTKMMAAYLVIRYLQSHPAALDEVVTFSRHADATVGSTAAIRAGESLSVRNLLYGLMLPSGNDAAVALAEHFGARLAGLTTKDASELTPVGHFIQQMNAAAKELEMTGTHYENPHGLQADGHASTARDLIRLGRAALELPLFAEIVNTPQYKCIVTGPGGYQRTVVWTNTNRLLRIEGYDGLKTGTTTPAGACLVSRGHRDGKTLLVAVLGATSSDGRYVDTRNLFRWGWGEREKEPPDAASQSR
ncbi:MAG: serine hydrolase [Planctomycetaceae bacterium]